MNWKLPRPDVALRVTRFLPEVAPASPVEEPKQIAGLSPMARALWRKHRMRETRKVEFKVTQPPPTL